MALNELSPYIKEQFLREFSPSERFYFIKKAKEALFVYGYTPGNDLYQYCYFLTQKKRLELLSDPGSAGIVRYLTVEGVRDIEETIKTYKDLLEKNKHTSSFEERESFIRFLESSS